MPMLVPAIAPPVAAPTAPSTGTMRGAASRPLATGVEIPLTAEKAEPAPPTIELPIPPRNPPIPPPPEVEDLASSRMDFDMASVKSLPTSTPIFFAALLMSSAMPDLPEKMAPQAEEGPIEPSWMPLKIDA